MIVCSTSSTTPAASAAVAAATSSSLGSSPSSSVRFPSSAFANHLDGLSGSSKIASSSTSHVSSSLPRLPPTATTKTTTIPAGMASSSGPSPPVTPQGMVPNHKHKHILLMLDMQKFMLEDEPIGVPAASIVYPNLKQVLEYARAAEPNPPLIIHVRNTGDPGEPDEPDTPGWELIFDPLPGEVVIDKRKNNAFAGTTLGSWVHTEAEIVVVGFQTDFSVRATCSAALGRGNEVILLREAHATFNRIEVLHGGGVTKAAAIEAEIEAELEEAGVHIFDMKDLPDIFADR